MNALSRGSMANRISPESGVADEVPCGPLTRYEDCRVDVEGIAIVGHQGRLRSHELPLDRSKPGADGHGFSIPVEQLEITRQLCVENRPGGSGVEHRENGDTVELDLDMNARSLRGTTRIPVEIADLPVAKVDPSGQWSIAGRYRRCRSGLTCGASCLSFRRKAARDSSAARSSPLARATHLPAWLRAFLRNHSMLSALFGPAGSLRRTTGSASTSSRRRSDSSKA